MLSDQTDMFVWPAHFSDASAADACNKTIDR